MKKIALIWFLFSVIGTTGIFSCSKDDSGPDADLIISKDELQFEQTGGTESFQIESNVSWTVASSESWCVVTPTAGKSGEIEIAVTVSENESTSERSAAITVTADNLSKQISVTQEALVFLDVAENEFSVITTGGDVILDVESSAAYAVTIDGYWIKASGGSTASPKFTLAANTGIERTGTVTLSLGGLTQVITISQGGIPLTIPADATGVGSDAMTLASKMKVGWNLGNTLECTNVSDAGVVTASETMWGNPKASKTLVDAVKAAGFNAIRLPCAWSGYIDDVKTSHIKDSWLARVKEVVNYCVDNDMYVIINIHWDGGWLENNPVYAKQKEINKKQKALWEQIAVYFRDYDEHVLFAGTNEVHYDYATPKAEHLAVQKSFNQTFVDAVRSTGGKNATRNLIVQSYNTNITYARDYMVMPTEPNGVTDRLMAEVHFYDPYDFTLDASSTKYFWGADFAGNANTSTWGQEAWVDEAFGMMKTKFVDNGIPVILGEYAVTLRATLTGQTLTDHIKSRNHWLNYVSKTAKLNGMIPFYWDIGPTGNNTSGLFNRSTGEQVHTDAIEAIVSPFEQ